MHRYIIRNSIFLFIIALVINSCDKSDVSDNAARLRIKLTDATSLVVKELHVEINAIEVFVTDSANTEGEWVVLDYSGGEYNLLTLMNGKTVQLVDQYFPAEKSIEKIRVTLGDNNRAVTVTNNSNTIPLQKSSEIVDGLVIENVNVELASNIISSIIIDINAALSIKENNGNWFLKPAARAFAETFGAQLKGYVSPREASSFVAIVQETDTFMTIPENDGMFLFFGLNEGPWEIHLGAVPGTIYRDTVFTDTLSAGQKKELTPKPIKLPFISSQ